jgi:hypothetical protein
MLFQRLEWIKEISGLPLLLEDAPFGWILYRQEPKGGLREVCTAESKRAMYFTLKGMYELLLAIEEQKKHQQQQKEQRILKDRESLV